MRRYNWSGFLFAVAVASTWGGQLRAEVKAPAERDRQVALAVCGLMEFGHITQFKIDDKISQRLHRQFFQAIDPLKLYLTQADIDEFAAEEKQHDDHTLQGNLAFAFDVYQRFIQRVDERCDWVLKELAMAPHDFTQEETLVRDPTVAKYAATEAEAKERWRVKTKYELLMLILGKDKETKTAAEKEKEARERLLKRYHNLKQRWHQFETDELVEMFLTALTNSFDPHSTYMSARTLEDFNISMGLSLEGIGAMLSSEDGTISVKEIVPGGAADLDGRIKPGDKIVGVGQGKDGEIEDIQEMTLRNVVKLIRGKAGTIVRLEVISSKGGKPVVIQMARQKIQLKDRAAKGEIVETPSINGVTYKVGIIRLPSFYADNEALRAGAADAKSATKDVESLLKDFNGQSVQAVVIDLRFNGGGLLNEAISLTGLFVDEGPIVQVKDTNGRVTSYLDETPGMIYKGPLVVLVSKFSASASEIFAGAIQDYKRGIVVGDSSTHGKGTVQQIYDLANQFRLAVNMGAIKLTRQMFYRVNGDSTQNRGVVSDVVLPSWTDHEDFSEAKLDYALNFDRIARGNYSAASYINAETIAQLVKASKERQSKDAELVKLSKRKARVHTRREQKTLTFTEASLRRDKVEDEDEDEDELERALDEGSNKKDTKFGTEPYTREVLSIVNDYLRLTQPAVTKR